MSIASALGISEEQLFSKAKICKNCKWYASYEGVCCNSDSKKCADFTDENFSCEKFESSQIGGMDNETN